MTSQQTAGFTASGRSLVDEEVIRLVSVGVDIGSSTTHMVFSRIELERQGNRYVVVDRTVLAESAILLTPYVDETRIDADALHAFVEGEYQRAGLRRDEVDTGALILTGVALRRRNARPIAELFALEAGRFVAVSAGDNLETVLAAHGSGAVALSEQRGATLLNVDIGGGTTKIAVCEAGRVTSVAAVDVGARLVATDADGRIVRLEESGRAIARSAGLGDLALGDAFGEECARTLAAYMADRLLPFIQGLPLGPAERALLRTDPPVVRDVAGVVFSGGVSEFIYGREGRRFGDLGPYVAEAIRARVDGAGLPVLEGATGIRATVIGASQYTVQVSGSTIFVEPVTTLPIRSVPVIAPELPVEAETIDPAACAQRVRQALVQQDLGDGRSPVAVAARWEGLATFGRIDGFCRGVVEGLEPVLRNGHPLILVFQGDVGGLFGLHLKETLQLANAVVSIDGVELRALNYIDIGELIPTSGSVPVVVKSLVFPASV